MLFSARARTDNTPKGQRESSFDFLDRSARPGIGRVRDLLASALTSYPSSDQHELVARITSTDETAFRSATFELLLFDMLRRAGFTLNPHPALPNGSQKRPDFHVTSPDASTFYLEAVLAGIRDSTNPAAEAIKATTLDLLRQAPHYSFLVEVDSVGDPTSQPSAKELIRHVHQWLDTLNPDELKQKMIDQGLESMPQFDWKHEDWCVSLRPIPLPLERRGRSTSLIGALGAEARWLDEWTPLRDAVKKKATRYGLLEQPLVVAVNAESFHLDPIDEMQALFGQEEYVSYVGHPELGGRMRRVANGAWNGPQGPQSRRVSAAWLFNGLTPYTIAKSSPTLYVNPWAHFEPTTALLQFSHARVVDNRLVRANGVVPREIFGVGMDWPE